MDKWVKNIRVKGNDNREWNIKKREEIRLGIELLIWQEKWVFFCWAVLTCLLSSEHNYDYNSEWGWCGWAKRVKANETFLPIIIIIMVVIFIVAFTLVDYHYGESLKIIRFFFLLLLLLRFGLSRFAV